jgi:hypothetical protein
MRKLKRRCLVVGIVVFVLVVTPAVLWLSLTHQPDFYRELVANAAPDRRAAAERFVARSLQLRNDIMNEPRWEAAFSDKQVNAWLAEDLVTHFADQIPPGVHEPRVSFEMDHVTLAFQMEHGPIRSVITVVARVRVPEENALALTLEKIRAGVLPVPADQILERITEHAIAHGMDLRWTRDGELPVALIRYRPNHRRRDIVLEHLQILNGQIRLSGRSDGRAGTATTLSLPSKRVLQSTFPRRKLQAPRDAGLPPMSSRRISTSPTI